MQRAEYVLGLEEVRGYANELVSWAFCLVL